jgi:uncharacterized membrane protein YtjA (UPF0391 family)
MLRLALVFLILALIAGAVGAYNVAVLASDIGWLLLVVFLVLLVISAVMSVARTGGPPA